MIVEPCGSRDEKHAIPLFMELELPWALRDPYGGCEVSAMTADVVSIPFFNPTFSRGKQINPRRHVLRPPAVRDVVSGMFCMPLQTPSRSSAVFCPQSSSCNSFYPPWSSPFASSLHTTVPLCPRHKRHGVFKDYHDAVCPTCLQ